MSVQIKDFKLKNKIHYEAFGIIIDFEPTAEMYEQYEKNQEEQLKIMMKHLDLSRLNLKREVTSQDVLNNMDKFNYEEIIEISKKYGKNQAEELVSLIPDLEIEDIKKHFSGISKNKSKNNSAYTKFIDDLSNLIIKNINDFQEEKEEEVGK